MPTVTINRKVFEELVGKKIPDAELKDRISMLGTDLESVDAQEIKVEIFPNRPDMLSEQGFARAFSSFIGVKTGLRSYEVKKSPYRLIVEDSVKQVRPYTACALIKGMQFTDERIREVIQIQEKLHTTFGRNRKKVAIGIYPNEKIKYPVYFRALAPPQIRFQPLGAEREMNAQEILEQHPAGKTYGHLLKGLSKYAVFQDVEDNILSLTPLVNSHLTGKVSETTKDVFIECSGFDFAACRLCLNIIVTALADMGGTVYSLSLEYSDTTLSSPDLKHQELPLELSYVNRMLGLYLQEKDIAELLSRMGFGFKKRAKQVFVQVPCYRADIMHPIDFVEDIAIAYGYENFVAQIPQVMTIAKEDPLAVFVSKISSLLTGLGFLETFTYHMSSVEKERDLMAVSRSKQLVLQPLIEIANSVSLDHNALRSSMLPSLLNVLRNNKHHELPHHLFDMGITFVLDSAKKTETGVREDTTLGIVLADEKVDYTKIRQVLEYLLQNLGVCEFSVKEAQHQSFIQGRCAEVFLGDIFIARLGEIHPQVLENWQLAVPVVALELNVSVLFGMVNVTMDGERKERKT